MAYFHGVRASEVETSLVSPVQIESGLVIAVDTAPVHLAKDPAAANEPVLCYSYDEYVNQFGYSGDFENYGLDEVARSQYALFGVAPTVFVNVLDPEKHYKEVETEIEGIVSTAATIESAMLLNSLKVESETTDTTVTSLTANTDYRATINVQPNAADDYYTIDIVVGKKLPSADLELEYDYGSGTGTTTVTVPLNVNQLPYDLPAGASNINLGAVVPVMNELEQNVDYTAGYNSDGAVVITCLKADRIVNDKVKMTYHELDPTKVTAEDIIGGVDLVTGKNKGLECVEDVYPKFRLVPGIIICPRFSQNVTVAAIMKAKCYDINGVFSAIAVADIPDTEVSNYTAAAEYKNKKNLIDSSLIVCYPKVSLGGTEYHLSVQLASLMNSTDSQHDSIPYKSPSNERLQMDKTTVNGEEIFLTLDKANYLNSQGIVTALNFSNGWCAWGNRTSIYPSSTDPREDFIPIRRMFNFIKNTLILTYFQKVDMPLTRRLLETIQDSVNLYLNGLTARGALLGGRVEILTPENPTTDLMDGIIRFHIYITPPSPAREIDFIVEYDPDYLATLFE